MKITIHRLVLPEDLELGDVIVHGDKTLVIDVIARTRDGYELGCRSADSSKGRATVIRGVDPLVPLRIEPDHKQAGFLLSQIKDAVAAIDTDDKWAIDGPGGATETKTVSTGKPSSTVTAPADQQGTPT